MTDHPSVLFVCVKNGGKSQMAAALMRDVAGDHVDVYSGGTQPGESLNAQSVAALAEIGVSVEGEHPKPIDAAILQAVDLVVVLGREAVVDEASETPIVTWETDEPSLRGIDGMDRMRLIRDDIAIRVRNLAEEITTR